MRKEWNNERKIMIHHKDSSVLGLNQDFGPYKNILPVDGHDRCAGGPSSSS